MSKWSKEELAALGVTKTYHEWGELTGYSKSYDGWETRRRRVNQVPPGVPSPASAPASPSSVRIDLYLHIVNTEG